MDAFLYAGSLPVRKRHRPETDFLRLPRGLFVVLGLISRGLLPFWKNFRGDFTAADEFLQIANDGAPSDAELAGQCRDIGPGFGIGDQAANFGLAAQAIGGTAEEE